MAERLGEAVLELSTDDTRLRRGLDSAHRQTEGFVKRAGLAMTRTGSILAAGVTLPLALMAKAGIADIGEIQAANRQTAAVIKSTGGAAGVTSKQVQALAVSLQKLSGIDDQAAQAGENMLLTFTNIRNEAGKGNDIFNQATAMLADLSVAMGKDMKTSAIQLGKALQDPKKGMMALSRVGVVFTDAQKKQVAALMKSGDVMKAQRIILHELNKEFGGSAAAAGKTLPARLAILKDSLEDVLGTLVESLIPAITDFTNVIAGVVDKFNDLSPGTKKTIASIALFVAAIGPAMIAVGGISTAIGGLIGVLFTVITPFGVVVAAVVGLGVWFIATMRKSEQFKAALSGAFDGIKIVAKLSFDVVSSLLQSMSGSMGDASKSGLSMRDQVGTGISQMVSIVLRSLGLLFDSMSRLPGLSKKMQDAFAVAGSGMTEAAIKMEAHIKRINFQKVFKAGEKAAIRTKKVWSDAKGAFVPFTGALRVFDQVFNEKTKKWEIVTAQSVGKIHAHLRKPLPAPNTSAVDRKIAGIATTISRQGPVARAAGVSVGKSASQGISSGLQSVDLMSVVRRLVGNVTQWFKHALGIASPSKLFDREVGWPISLGIAQGILRGSGAVGKAGEKLLTRLQGVMDRGAAKFRLKTSLADLALAIHGDNSIRDMKKKRTILGQEIRRISKLLKTEGRKMSLDMRASLIEDLTNLVNESKDLASQIRDIGASNPTKSLTGPVTSLAMRPRVGGSPRLAMATGARSVTRVGNGPLIGQVHITKTDVDVPHLFRRVGWEARKIGAY